MNHFILVFFVSAICWLGRLSIVNGICYLMAPDQRFIWNNAWIYLIPFTTYILALYGVYKRAHKRLHILPYESIGSRNGAKKCLNTDYNAKRAACWSTLAETSFYGFFTDLLPFHINASYSRMSYFSPWTYDEHWNKKKLVAVSMWLLIVKKKHTHTKRLVWYTHRINWPMICVIIASFVHWTFSFRLLCSEINASQFTNATFFYSRLADDKYSDIITLWTEISNSTLNHGKCLEIAFNLKKKSSFAQILQCITKLRSRRQNDFKTKIKIVVQHRW